MKKMNKKGFTIVELVIVIAVIGILAAVLIPTFSSVIEKANLSAAQSEAKNALTLDLAEANGDFANIPSTVENDNYVGVVDADTNPTTYTVVVDEYTCVYTIATGTWAITETAGDEG